MKIIFITINEINDINLRGLIYHDLLRKFSEHGHEIYVVTALERKDKKKTFLNQTSNAKILNVRTLNIQKTNFIEKGLGIVLIEFQYLSAIKKYFKDVKFDLIIYPTPTITFSNAVEYVKNRDNAFAYLLLKDIFPQNAVDIGLMKKNSFLHKFFRRKEKKLYRVSDKIGCMSQANVDFVLNHNLYLPKDKVEVCPNTVEPIERGNIVYDKLDLKKQFNLPLNKTIFVYGGNLGKPQGIDFLIDVLESNLNHPRAFFLIIGNGTEFPKLKKWFTDNSPKNALLYQFLPKVEYDNILRACDVGLIFLDYRFTIPNYPSRVLSYMENAMPIIAATDTATDIGETIIEGNFGFWSPSNDVQAFNDNLNACLDFEKIKLMGENARNYLELHFTPEVNYQTIMSHFNSSNRFTRKD